MSACHSDLTTASIYCSFFKSLPSFCLLRRRHTMVHWSVFSKNDLGTWATVRLRLGASPSPVGGVRSKLSFPWHSGSLSLAEAPKISMVPTIPKWKATDFPRQLHISIWHPKSWPPGTRQCILFPYRQGSLFALSWRKTKKLGGNIPPLTRRLTPLRGAVKGWGELASSLLWLILVI